MKKVTITYDTPLDAIIAIAKRMALNESKYRIDSEEFFRLYQKDEMGDDADVMEWATDYQDYLNLRIEIADRLRNVA